ncbi:hypothetical protein L0668_20125 [Paraglaciecola aquimarina]|uniref:DUF4426 domain-containing protein n=1 Tax=Paraglaciecola algarum TaxID=3050085 RepID=A0ABS9DBT8_9ALTE|nr:hypothetical protein [Paraglaciecola sp. G1-23]MCF2950428.1 hypothetical protein [Paraglaciecola sp. G1-23]
MITILCLISCMSFANQNYDADIQKLQNKASKSSDLYVEPEFNFKTYKSITLDIVVTNEFGDPSANVIMRISSLPVGDNIGTDELWAKKSVISLVRTDQFGRVFRQIEVSNSVNSLLLELHQQTANNIVELNLPDSLYVSHTFEIH